MKNNKAGFSLVELMVVVAIIGILATVAIPNFTKFQNKAKQSNAKSELGGLYTAQKAFFSEYSGYNANMVAVGYVPEGLALTGRCVTGFGGTTSRYYTVGFNAATANIGAGMPNPPCVASGASLANSFQYLNNKLGPAAVVAPISVAAVTGTASGVAPDVVDTSFVAEAQASFIGTAAAPVFDIWQIDNNGALQNTTPGI